ncbi:MAG: hypothetical protein KYX69_19680 [Sphingomonas sp.]|uniref:hypothetical protein n=1 Tax=Sphingomonas sp. TaxID=28214 RepID=UPI002633F1B6|nr:hypothetical protein [Sphingomonas sp.]MDK2769925.1 hypothetical protein [Sphingomonas sp.]
MARTPRRLARGTNAEIAVYAGPSGEAIVSTTDHRLVVQNGVAGGVPHALVSEVDAARVGPGAVIGFARNTAPTGWLKANMAAVDRSIYADLDTAIYCGDANNATAEWGYRCTNPANPTGTRSTTGGYIVVPEGRSEFVRGWDDGRGIDTGRSLWSMQAQALQSHTHSYTDPGHSHTLIGEPGSGLNGSIAVDGATLGPIGDGNQNTNSSVTGITINSTGGTETRPRNLTLLMCVKY